MKVEYDEVIEAVGKLLRKGISMDDSIEIVDLLFGDIKTIVHFSDGRFQRDVLNKVGRVPTPRYKNIIRRHD